MVHHIYVVTQTNSGFYSKLQVSVDEEGGQLCSRLYLSLECSSGAASLFTLFWKKVLFLPNIFRLEQFLHSEKAIEVSQIWAMVPPPLIGNKKVLLGCHAAGIAFPIKSAPRAGPILSNGFCHTEGDTREKEERNGREKDERNRGERKKRKTRAKQERMKG